MKVIDKMKELKKEGISCVWIRDNEEGYEYIYGLIGYSSIENNEYVERYKEVFNKEVESVQVFTQLSEARITYKVN